MNAKAVYGGVWALTFLALAALGLWPIILGVLLVLLIVKGLRA